jgi:hypothetical protein
MSRGGALAALVLVGVLAGCGGGDPGASSPGASDPTGAPDPSSAAPASAQPAPATDLPADPRSDAGRPVERDPLAIAAEEAAASAAAASGELLLGGDVSWPQCPRGMGIPERPTMGLPMPLDSAAYVVVGLTNGPGFFPNPCLADQVAWVAGRGLRIAAYSVISYPDAATLATYADRGPFDGGTPLGALRNTGFQQARFNIASMKRAGLLTPIVWLDIESVPGFDWTVDKQANAAVIQGAARGYTSAGYRIGIYSTPAIWDGIAGGLSFGVPEWRAAGPTSMVEALRRCEADWSIQGGPGVLAQWVEGQRDLDTTCPETSGDLSGLFHQY